jgi:predicted RNA-binding Zn-ribbon protein involved in translation (DUF1610 family)
MSTLARAGTRNTVLIVVVVLLLAVAAWRLVRWSSGSSAIPTDESTWVYFVCADCGAYFHLNAREVEEAMARGDVASTGMGGTTSFRCKECGELKAIRAGKCPQHGVIIKLRPGPDEPRKCPECGWRP